MHKKTDIFLTFLKFGALTFGGGYAMLGVMQEELVKKKAWLSEDEMSEVISISETTPGPFSINAATFIGYKRAGFIGSFLATLGVVLPSLIITIIISLSLTAFQEIKLIQNALSGIKAGTVVLILLATMGLARNVEWKWRNIIIAILAFSLAFFTTIQVILIMLGSVLLSIISFLIKKKGSNDNVN